jgi:hypothetical protein
MAVEPSGNDNLAFSVYSRTFKNLPRHRKKTLELEPFNFYFPRMGENMRNCFPVSELAHLMYVSEVALNISPSRLSQLSSPSELSSKLSSSVLARRSLLPDSTATGSSPVVIRLSSERQEREASSTQ